MIPGDVHILSDIYLMAEENPGKPQLGDHLIKAVQPVIASNGVPYLQMISKITTMPGREREKEVLHCIDGVVIIAQCTATF